MTLKNTLKSRINYRIKRSAIPVFLRKDFSDIGGYDQVGRILKKLVDEEILIPLGYGLYARAKKSQVSGKMIPEKTLQELALQAMKKLHVKTAPSKAENLYSQGHSNQVPMGRVIGVKGRISRKIGYDGKYITFERAS
jgi:hypothetical protein